MEIDENISKYLINKRNKLDVLWEMIPEDSRYENRFARRELRISKYKTPMLEIYEVEENSFIAMCKKIFNIEQLSLSEAYDLVEQLEIKKINK